jgi:hypothetical protein
MVGKFNHRWTRIDADGFHCLEKLQPRPPGAVKPARSAGSMTPDFQLQRDTVAFAQKIL